MVLAVVALVVALAVPPRLHLSRAREEWTKMAVGQLRQLGPPPPAVLTAARTGTWAVASYLVFSNDWAAFTNHSLHAPDELGEIALLRTSDGRIYRTKHHFCNDINEFMIEAEQLHHNLQPSDLQQFFSVYGTNKNWQPLAGN